jgi:hypothetical protein
MLEKFGKGRKMADTLNAKYGRTSAAWAKWFKAVKHRGRGFRERRMWVSASSDPAVDANSHTTYPVAVGDCALRADTEAAFICTVAPTANTAATFVQVSA